MSTESGVAAPPKKASSSWIIWIVIAAGACVPLLGILAALSIYGVRKYIQNAKRAEGQHVVLELATLIARCAQTRATGGVPKVPLTAVRMARKRMYFSPAKAVRELGLPQTDVAVALGDAAEWFCAHGYATLPAGAPVSIA